MQMRLKGVKAADPEFPRVHEGEWSVGRSEGGVISLREAAAKPEFRKAAEFFNRFRSLCAAAYYATPPGWEAIGYVGNVALAKFDGPPPEVLERLGVTQTVA